MTDYQPETTGVPGGPKPIGIMIRHNKTDSLIDTAVLFFQIKYSGHRMRYRLWNPSREYYWSAQHGNSRLHFFNARRTTRKNTTMGVYRGPALQLNALPPGLTLADVPDYQPDANAEDFVDSLWAV
jgi:hypothetical protein